MNKFKEIVQWAEDRNIIKGSSTFAQYLKLGEEVGEVASAMVKNKAELPKEIGDCVVVLTIIAKQYGYDIEDCIRMAHEKNSKRKGKMNDDGVWVKQEDL